jgi:thiol-disulfide isomerase/thioredoxin
MKDDQLHFLGTLGQFGFVLAAAALVYGFVGGTREGEMRRRCAPSCLLRPAYMSATRKAPVFELEDLQGGRFRLESLRGKVVVLNFWTKTCRPCLDEMPSLAEFARLMRKRTDVAVVTVSTDEDRREAFDVLRGLLTEPPPFPVLFDGKADVVRGKYGTRLFPETWVIDAQGVIRARFDGARDWTEPVFIEFIEQVRSGGYCPIEMQAGQVSGPLAKLCEG